MKGGIRLQILLKFRLVSFHENLSCVFEYLLASGPGL